VVARGLPAPPLSAAHRVQVTMGKVQRELVVTRSDGQVRLALASSPAQPDAGLKTWHDRIFSLWPVDVLGKDEIPAEGNPQNALRLDYAAGGRPLGFLEIAKVAALTSSGEDAKAKQDALFARSERTLGWVKLGTDAQNLLADTPAALR
jgi:hypothetical protein